MKIYGSMLCKDCVECRAAYDAAGISYEFLSITDDLPTMKEFLRLRDESPLFEQAKAQGGIGIPCVVKADGDLTLDWEALLPSDPKIEGKSRPQIAREEKKMLYTPLTKKAMRLAYQAHHGQVDKTGLPYIFHPMHLAEQMQDENTTIAALLHDVVEDTPYTLGDLAAEGFPAAVIDALALLTHDPAVPYFDYVYALRENEIARAVKRADLLHNSDLSRLDVVDERALCRAGKYRKAMEILDEEADGSGGRPDLERRQVYDLSASAP